MKNITGIQNQRTLQRSAINEGNGDALCSRLFAKSNSSRLGVPILRGKRTAIWDGQASGGMDVVKVSVIQLV